MIRKAIEKDTERIAELFLKTLTPWSSDGVASSIKKDLCLVYEEGDIDGVIILSRAADECEILNFAVDAKKRRQGIGKLLLKEALGHDFIKDARVFLDVRVTNQAAISLYNKFGFEEIARRKNYYTSPREDAVIMKLSK